MGNTIIPMGDAMRHRLELRAVLMDLMAGVEIKGDEAMIQVLAQFSKRNASHVRGTLNLTTYSYMNMLYYSHFSN